MTNTFGDNRLSGLDPFPNYVKEMTMTAGLLALYGFINLVSGVFGVVRHTADGQDWSGDSDVYPPVVMLLAALVQVTFSVVSMAVGFQYLVTGTSAKMWTKLSAVLSLLSFFTLVVIISYYAFQADKNSLDFIDFGSNPSRENRSVATLGILGYIAYEGTNFGALIHLNMKMSSFESEKWISFHRGYYKLLLMFFGFLTLLAGVAQLALGAYVYDKVGEERLSSPVITSQYYVTYPEISMAVGCLQVLLGLYIMFRAAKKPAANSSKGMTTFHYFAWFVLLSSIATQVLTQMSMSVRTTSTKDAAAGYAAWVVCLVVGLGLFPIYLDAMYHTTPDKIEHAWFSATAPWKKDVVDEERKVEPAPQAAQAPQAPQAVV